MKTSESKTRYEREVDNKCTAASGGELRTKTKHCSKASRLFQKFRNRGFQPRTQHMQEGAPKQSTQRRTEAAQMQNREASSHAGRAVVRLYKGPKKPPLHFFHDPQARVRNAEFIPQSVRIGPSASAMRQVFRSVRAAPCMVRGI
jgi:hypothetical protein